MGTRKIGPAVAAGCTMVVKPASQTPLSMLALAQILEEAGLPGGVLNVITSSSSGSVMAPLIHDPRTRKLSFTGSTEVGRKLIEESAEQVLRVSMELGGNAPFLVFEDADLDAAVDGAMLAKMRNIGEACTAANRFYVAEPVAEAFAARLAERMRGLKVGRGTEEGVDLGPLIDDDQRGKVAGAGRGRGDQGRQGAPRRHGCRRPGLLLPADRARRRAADRAPAEGGDLRPGRAGDHVQLRGGGGGRWPTTPSSAWSPTVYTGDVKRAFRVCEALETGMIGLNQGIVSNPAAPFGGVKHSGFGREGGNEGIEEYLETKYVAVNL